MVNRLFDSIGIKNRSRIQKRLEVFKRSTLRIPHADESLSHRTVKSGPCNGNGINPMVLSGCIL